MPPRERGTVCVLMQHEGLMVCAVPSQHLLLFLFPNATLKGRSHLPFKPLLAFKRDCLRALRGLNHCGAFSCCAYAFLL